MKKIKVRLDIGFPTATRTAIIKIDDDLDEDGIWEVVDEWADKYIDKGYEIIEEV